MNSISNAARKHAARIVALPVVAVAYAETRIPDLSEGNREALAERFSAEPLAAWPEGPYRTTRNVNPSFDEISAWISADGAAAQRSG
jgi:hypothetical protein